MRLFLFLILSTMISSPLLACTEADFALPAPANNIYNCLSLTISSAGLNRSSDSEIDPLIINVTGDVLIEGNISINGGDGSNDAVFFTPGGLATSSSSFGGGHDGSATEDGNPSATEISDGKTSPQENPCSSGGGGAGFATNGENGKKCATSTAQSNRGLRATNAEFSFTTNFRGGFGGGAGGLGISGASFGAGGGGGGALKIYATGKITIKSGVTISSVGGKGGNSTSDGGGGGGGSGGAIWLIADGGIVNNGIIDTSGGAGGKNNSTGAHGGKGAAGRFRLESAGKVTEGSGKSTPVSRNLPSKSSPKLDSDISCGVIAPNNDHNNIFSMMMGFILVAIAGIRFPLPVAKKRD